MLVQCTSSYSLIITSHVAVAAYLKFSNRKLKKTLLLSQSYHALNDFARYVYLLVICNVGHLKNSDYR